MLFYLYDDAVTSETHFHNKNGQNRLKNEPGILGVKDLLRLIRGII